MERVITLPPFQIHRIRIRGNIIAQHLALFVTFRPGGVRSAVVTCVFADRCVQVRRTRYSRIDCE